MKLTAIGIVSMQLTNANEALFSDMLEGTASQKVFKGLGCRAGLCPCLLRGQLSTGAAFWPQVLSSRRKLEVCFYKEQMVDGFLAAPGKP